jgi:hypothetical protein
LPRSKKKAQEKSFIVRKRTHARVNAGRCAGRRTQAQARAGVGVGEAAALYIYIH